MSLPLPTVPTYEIELPVSKKTIKYRPFLVKEEKILLIANETEDVKQITLAIDQVLEACTFNKIDIKSLPVADVEYLFIKVRSDSIGELMHVIYKCPHCNEKTPHDINLTNVIVKNNVTNHNIKIGDDSIITMVYPSRNMFEDIDIAPEDLQIESIVRCISMITIGDSVYMTSDLSLDDVRAYVLGLTIEQKNKLQEFITSLPYIEYTETVECPKCKGSVNLTMEGLYDFFG